MNWKLAPNIDEIILGKLPKAISEFIELGFLKNRWVLGHAFLGGIFANIFLLLHMDKITVWILTFTAAIIIEALEWLFQNQIAIFTYFKRAIYDSLGDIIATMIVCEMVIIL